MAGLGVTAPLVTLTFLYGEQPLRCFCGAFPTKFTQSSLRGPRHVQEWRCDENSSTVMMEETRPIVRAG